MTTQLPLLDLPPLPSLCPSCGVSPPVVLIKAKPGVLPEGVEAKGWLSCAKDAEYWRTNDDVEITLL